MDADRWPRGTLLINNVPAHLQSPRPLASVLSQVSEELRHSRELTRGQSLGTRGASASVVVFVF